VTYRNDKARGPSSKNAPPPKQSAKNARFSAPQTARAPLAHAEPVGELLYGYRAALSAIEVSPSRVRAAYALPELARELQAKLGAQLVVQVEPSARLAARVDTGNHEGVVLEVSPRVFVSPAELAKRLIAAQAASGAGAGASRRASMGAVALDRVRNPYNTGAILRTAGFLGYCGAILGSMAPHPALPADAVRVAEGGVEHLALARTTDLAASLRRMREAGVDVYVFESEAKDALTDFHPGRPFVLVVGHEREGVSEQVRAECTRELRIPGSGKVHSLNVSIAASIGLAWLGR
jgi:RNA methyltransferase, TrmH family